MFFLHPIYIRTDGYRDIMITLLAPFSVGTRICSREGFEQIIQNQKKLSHIQEVVPQRSCICYSSNITLKTHTYFTGYFHL